MEMFPMSRNLINNLLPDAPRAARPSAVALRPARLDDVEAIMAMHQRLSADSIYSRYHSPRLPSREEIARIAGLDGDGGLALVAVLPGRSGEVVGLAYYVVTGQKLAEVAFLVEDAYQGQGIGKRLVEALSRAAVAHGVCFFDAYVLAANRPMQHLLQQRGRLVGQRRDFSALEMRLELAC